MGYFSIISRLNNTHYRNAMQLFFALSRPTKIEWILLLPKSGFLLSPSTISFTISGFSKVLFSVVATDLVLECVRKTVFASTEDTPFSSITLVTVSLSASFFRRSSSKLLFIERLGEDFDSCRILDNDRFAERNSGPRSFNMASSSSALGETSNYISMQLYYHGLKEHCALSRCVSN